MRVTGIMDTNYQDYKKCSMLISTSECNWKCCIDSGCDICQNLPLAKARIVDIDDIDLVHRYLSNPLSHAVVLAGLDPMDTFPETWAFINTFRRLCDDEIIIYTGYNEDEIADKVSILAAFSNIIIKFGRFIPNDVEVYDEILGIKLASHNQYARRIS